MLAFSLGQKLMLWLIQLVLAITVHEAAHGWAAYLCGDATAKRLGRLTLNPIKHIDYIGTIAVPIVLFLWGGFIFGWAKPVPITWKNLRHPRRDMALIAVSGPLANLGMAFLWAALSKLSAVLNSTAFAYAYMVRIGVSINLVLMFLNLIPIPPLDGSRIVASFLPSSMRYRFNQLEEYGFLLLILLLASGVLAKLVGPLLQGLLVNFFSIFGL